MRKIIYLPLFTLFFYLNNTYSQGGICGTYISNAQNTLEKSISIIPLNPTQGLPKVNKDLPVAFYIVKDSNNLVNISQSTIDAALSRLNGYFEPIDLKFHSCNIVYVDNYQFDNLVQDGNEKDLTTYYNTPNVICLYIVSAITDKYKKPVKGFAYMPGDNKNSIFLTKENLNTSEIGHQFGHFFNLYHTHETYFGGEEVNNPTTCSTTGDLCCDTDADPKLSDASNVNCDYTGKLKDSNNKFYTPSVKNIMSFAPNNCRCNFSQTQYLRVIYALNNLKPAIK